MTAPRQVEVAPDRLPGWLDRFQASHGEIHWTSDDATYLVTATDGAWARLAGWNAVQDTPPDLSQWTAAPDGVGVLLLRRGGYAVGLVRSGKLTKHKCGTRYVQSKTAAGGWSQHRYARRRSNQADDLVRVAGAKAAEILAGDGPDALVVGGDKVLIAQALGQPGLKHLAHLPTREFYDIADPRFDVLQDVVKRAVAVRVTVWNASAGK
ncbi:MAG: acVLRF1 family peptidyl-tRNA hydrolase [Ornithinimicrobium sp.]